MLSKYKKNEIKEQALTGLKFKSYTNGYISIKANDVLELLEECEYYSEVKVKGKWVTSLLKVGNKWKKEQQ